jgi:hypothetical protein
MKANHAAFDPIFIQHTIIKTAPMSFCCDTLVRTVQQKKWGIKVINDFGMCWRER